MHNKLEVYILKLKGRIKPLKLWAYYKLIGTVSADMDFMLWSIGLDQ